MNSGRLVSLLARRHETRCCGRRWRARFRGDLTVTTFPAHRRKPLLNRAFFPLSILAGLTTLTTIAVNLAVTRMVFSFKKLMPDFSRLNPSSENQEPGQYARARRRGTSCRDAGDIQRHHLSDRQNRMRSSSSRCPSLVWTSAFKPSPRQLRICCGKQRRSSWSSASSTYSASAGATPRACG